MRITVNDITGGLKLDVMILLNCLLVIMVLMFTFTFSVNAVIGEPNATVQTLLEVGNVYPEVLNVSIEEGAATFSLTPNSTTTLYCIARVRDFNGDADMQVARGVFFDTSVSFLGDTDDNNYHYTNSSCNLTTNGTWQGHADDAYISLANCSFQVEYYANPNTWNCSITINDTYGWEANGNDSITMNELLAIGLPDTINYGEVNATEVSLQNVTNVTNFGNVALNLSLEGYAKVQGDGNAMNCSLGALENISIEHEKFNLTSGASGVIDLAQAEVNYTNLTTTPVIYNYSLIYRQNDTNNNAQNYTYWRMYVPIGVAGNCTGNIIFGATTANGI